MHISEEPIENSIIKPHVKHKKSNNSTFSPYMKKIIFSGFECKLYNTMMSYKLVCVYFVNVRLCVHCFVVLLHHIHGALCVHIEFVGTSLCMSDFGNQPCIRYAIYVCVL